MENFQAQDPFAVDKRCIDYVNNWDACAARFELPGGTAFALGMLWCYPKSRCTKSPYYLDESNEKFVG